MADFNKIFIDSPLLVNIQEYTSLGFNDGKLMSKSKYSIANHTLNILNDSYNTLSVFSNNGIANSYEYRVHLYADSTFLPSQDLQGAQLNSPELDKILVFIDGELEPKTFSYIEDGHVVEQNTYDVIDNRIRINRSYTNNRDKFFDVIVYTTTANFQRYTYTKNEILGLDFTSLTLPFAYDINNTLLFINNLKVDFTAIEGLNTNNISNVTSAIKLNLDLTINDIDSFEIIKFLDNSTSSINFESSQGYLTYGPYDAFNNRVPNKYDTIFTFSDQAKILIDNIRQGFILKAVDGYGEAIIVDDTFESQEVHALLLGDSLFKYNNYTYSEFYLEVPEYTNITKYLAEYDKKYTFLPEILNIFQRVLLDDINDTIQRLRDVRNINKVDSVHINNLLSLLGFNANIKTLNKKQRRELLEELNEFYRIVGTRNSYNLVNILQNNLKLINAEQLFTPFGKYFRSDKVIYDYSYAIKNPGHDYEINNVLATKYNTLLTVTDVFGPDDPEYSNYPKGIKAFSVNTQEGDIIINVENEPLVSPFKNTSIITINSVISSYAYSWSVESYITSTTPGAGYYVGEELTTLEGFGIEYKIKVTSVGTSGANKGKILTYDRIGSYADYGSDNIYKDQLDLYKVSDLSVSAKISTINTEVLDSQSNYTIPEEINIVLQPGVYKFELAGAGGSGGAGDSTSGNYYDLYATPGSSGELITTGYIYLSETTNLKAKIGQGGGRVKARGHDSKYTIEKAQSDNLKGFGWENGEKGNIAFYSPGWGWGWCVSGQGGGSTGIQLSNSTNTQTYVARGGNGGEAWACESGKGGSGGVTSGGGGAGGARSGDSFWSQDGENGWLKIFRYKTTYKLDSVQESGAVSVPDGDSRKLLGTPTPGNMTITKADNQWSLSPISGDTFNNIYLKPATYYTLDSQVTHYAKLTITSTPYQYSYNDVKLITNSSLLEVGNTFTTVIIDPEHPDHETPVDPDHSFTCVVTEVNRNDNTFKIDYYLTAYPDKTDPSHYKNGIPYGSIPITAQYDAKLAIGQGATIDIASVENTQKMEDRCYIDFYTKEECGAEKKTEFREEKIDYGDITIGTPNAPYWWIPGNPDIDYGSIASPITEFDEDNDYGYISEPVSGKWVEWWEWDRQNIWYPTNHVNLEFKIPAGEDFTQYTNTFVEQFYNIASTVLFIHALVTSFYFGKDTTASSDSQSVDNLGECFGIATGFPIVEQEYTVTSDPYIQNLSFWDGTEFDLTIIPYPKTATVTVYNTDTDTQIATGVGETTVQGLLYGTNIKYTISATGYTTKSSHITIKHATHIATRNGESVYEICKYPILEYTGNDTNNYHTLSINTIPENATVNMTLKASDNPVLANITNQTKTLTVMHGNIVEVVISCNGYDTQTHTYTVTTDMTEDIELAKAVPNS